MIERKFIKEKLNDYKIQQFLLKRFEKSSYSHAIIQKTPLGDKLIIFSSKPGLIVGRGGCNLKEATIQLKNLGMQNPQIDIQEIDEPYLNPSIVAERIVEMFERMGTGRFKFIGHNICKRVIDSGARGVQVTLAGRIPASRSKMWKFINGFLPKCGSISDTEVRESFRIANLKTGVIGVRVKILPPNVRMPDDIIIIEKKTQEQSIPLSAKNKEDELIAEIKKQEEIEKNKEKPKTKEAKEEKKGEIKEAKEIKEKKEEIKKEEVKKEKKEEVKEAKNNKKLKKD